MVFSGTWDILWVYIKVKSNFYINRSLLDSWSLTMEQIRIDVIVKDSPCTSREFMFECLGFKMWAPMRCSTPLWVSKGLGFIFAWLKFSHCNRNKIYRIQRNSIPCMQMDLLHNFPPSAFPCLLFFFSHGYAFLIKKEKGNRKKEERDWICFYACVK